MHNTILYAPWVCTAIQLAILVAQILIWMVLRDRTPTHQCVYCDKQIKKDERAHPVSLEIWAHEDCSHAVNAFKVEAPR